MKNNNTFFLLLLMFSLSPSLYSQEEGPISPEEIATYGELFLVEEKIQLEDTFEFQLYGGSVLNNSAFRIYSAQFGISYYLNHFLNVGITGAKNFFEKSQYYNAIEEELKDDGEIQTLYPETEIFAKVGLIPFKGNLNFFNKGGLTYYLFVDLGVGFGQSEVDTYQGGYLSAGFKLDMNEYVSLLSGLRQTAFILDEGYEYSGSWILGLTLSIR